MKALVSENIAASMARIEQLEDTLEMTGANCSCPAADEIPWMCVSLSSCKHLPANIFLCTAEQLVESTSAFADKANKIKMAMAMKNLKVCDFGTRQL